MKKWLIILSIPLGIIACDKSETRSKFEFKKYFFKYCTSDEILSVESCECIYNALMNYYSAKELVDIYSNGDKEQIKRLDKFTIIATRACTNRSILTGELNK